MTGGDSKVEKFFEFRIAGWEVCCGVQMSLTVTNPVFVCKTCGAEKPVEWEVKIDA